MMTRPTGKRRSGKRSPNSPTPKSKSPPTSPVVGSKWHIARPASQRKKRISLLIAPPPQSTMPPVLIESGDADGIEVIYEEPNSAPHISHLQLTPPRPGPVRTRPYEAPYFFPTPGSPEAIGYVERVREERRTVLFQPELRPVKSKKDLKRRSSTLSSPEKDGTPDNTRLHGEDGYDQATEGSGEKRPKSAGTGSGRKNSSPPPSSANELGVRVRTPILRKSSAPAQLSSMGVVPGPTTPNRPQTQRQGSLAIMRILGKH